MRSAESGEPVWAEVMKTAERLGYKAEGLRSTQSFTEVRLCRTSGKRATEACEAAGSAYTESVPFDQVPGANDLCPTHLGAPSGAPRNPPRAVPVNPGGEPTPQALPVDEVPRAQPVDNGVPRAQPVREATPRALPVRESPPRALPVE